MTTARLERNRFLARLRFAILADFNNELVLCSKVALLQAAGYKRSEIARKLDYASTPDLLRAEERVRRAAERLDAGDD